MKSRRPACESFEPRQLLAGDVCLADAPIERIAATESAPLVVTQGFEGEGIGVPAVKRIDALNSHAMVVSPVIWDLAGMDLVEEQGGQVVAIRSHFHPSVPIADRPLATAYFFDRQDNGSLVQSGSVELPFMPRKLILTDEMLMVVGSAASVFPAGGDVVANFPIRPVGESTVLLAINRDDLDQRTTITMDGFLVTAAVTDDRLYVSTLMPPSFDHFMMVPPSPLMHLVTVFDTSGSVPVRASSGELPSAVTADMIVGDDIVMLERSTYDAVIPLIGGVPGEAVRMPMDNGWEELGSRLIRYRINGSEIDEVASLELPDGYQLRSEISADGKSAVVYATASLYRVADVAWVNQVASSVHLIDLSEDQPSLFETIDLSTRGFGVLAEIGSRAFVVADGKDSLIVVNTDQAIDIDSQNRVRRIALPGDPNRLYPGVTSVTEVTPDIYVIARQTSPATNGSATIRPSSIYEILTLSLSEGAIVSQSIVDGTTIAVFAPDSASPHLIHLYPMFGETDRKQLIVASIDDAGQFVARESIDLAGTLEIDADENRAILRQIDQLVEYRWDDIENPIQTPLGDPLPAPIAIDDVFERNAESLDRYLDVLANDQLVGHAAVGLPQIIELIGAPAGVTIAPGNQVLRLTGDAALSDGTFEFEYVLRQGKLQSTASVTLTLFRYTDTDIQQAVERIISQAAEDLGVEASEIRVGSQQRWTSRVMPSRFGDSVPNPLGGQFGVIVDLVVADELYRYAANFENDVARLNSRRLATVMSLSMRVVDADGNGLETVKTGDEFFVEVTADDLRDFGQGVFAVAFDLPIPTNQVELTGEIVLLGEFDDIGSPTLDEGIDEFNAIEVLFEHPGNASQSVVRFGMRAIAGGDVSLRLDPAESLGAELLLRGVDDEVSPVEVDFGVLDFVIDGIEPTDTDANGAVTPSDALRVINFLGLYGSVPIEQLEALSSDGEGEVRVVELNAMRRLDTNADGKISARDALQVINKLARSLPAFNGEAEPVDVDPQVDFLFDEDEKRFGVTV